MLNSISVKVLIVQIIIVMLSVTNAWSSEEALIRASYYSSGSRTACGESFDPQGFTAASRTLPFGTRLHVTNPATGRSVIVRINDRGPYVRGRGLDLAKGAAEAIGMIGQGTAMLSVARLN